jgi:hypothetical protein
MGRGECGVEYEYEWIVESDEYECGWGLVAAPGW